MFSLLIKIKMREQPRRGIGKITEFQIVVKCFLFFTIGEMKTTRRFHHMKLTSSQHQKQTVLPHVKHYCTFLVKIAIPNLNVLLI